MSQADWCQPNIPVPPKGEYQNPRLRISALCEMGWQPLLIGGLLIDQLRRHFGDAGTIESNDLRRYVWQDSEKTGILIESVYRWRGDVVELRPAVLVGRNAYQNQRLSIADLSGIDERRGTQEHTVMWIGSHTLFCIHGTGAGVDILATEVQRELTQFSPAIRQYLGLAKFQVTEVGAISEVEESTENFVVPVTVGWAYQENWTLRYESLALRRFPLSVLLGLEPFQTAAGTVLR